MFVCWSLRDAKTLFTRLQALIRSNNYLRAAFSACALWITCAGQPEFIINDAHADRSESQVTQIGRHFSADLAVIHRHTHMQQRHLPGSM